MKRLLPIACLAIMLCAAMGLHAQTSQRPAAPEKPFYDSSRASHFLEINLHAGIGISSVLQNYGKVIDNLSDFCFSPGVLIRTGVEVRFNIRQSFGLGTGLDFGINNSQYAMSILSNNGASINSLYVKNHFYDLSIPVYLSFRFNVGRSMTWNVDPGWYLAQGIGGHSSLSGYTSGENSLGQPVVTHSSYRHKYFQSAQPFVNSVQNFDHGPRLYTGLKFKSHVTFGIVGMLSARNLATHRTVLPVKYRHASLCFLFGYAF